ncbi:sortase [Modestobacter sp. I12A-02628]|uniref:Sortase n=1 Tax=Goekera deserti TaxID=2497753 RepID=A0A7K3WHN6_9ACTN|nr:class F sortase [Goekera deserti]MPQ97752.1 sortase [Goekera deserti]NDI48397.1 sortase [Goekera deserti]NEL55998.1 sortase [Goekera deserti]
MRSAAATLVVGLALAVGTPAVWALSRPPAAAGPPVEQVLDSPAPAPVLDPAPPSGPAGQAPPPVPVRDASPTPPVEVPAPVGLSVPGVGVDAAVDPVGVEPDGSMSVPRDVDRVGWYRFGPAPGQPGSAVLAGHVDSATDGLGAMAPVRSTEVGDEVTVTAADGATTRWRVVARQEFVKQELPRDQLFARDGPPRLVLITCGGPFQPDTGSYRDNVVVVAEPA